MSFSERIKKRLSRFSRDSRFLFDFEFSSESEYVQRYQTRKRNIVYHERTVGKHEEDDLHRKPSLSIYIENNITQKHQNDKASIEHQLFERPLRYL